MEVTECDKSIDIKEEFIESDMSYEEIQIEGDLDQAVGIKKENDVKTENWNNANLFVALDIKEEHESHIKNVGGNGTSSNFQKLEVNDLVAFHLPNNSNKQFKTRQKLSDPNEIDNTKGHDYYEMELIYTFKQKMYKCDGNDNQLCDLKMEQLKLENNCEEMMDGTGSKVKIYKCNFCDYATKYSYRLRRHKSKHTNPTEIEMYKCIACDYKTKDKWHLTTHVMRHKDESEGKCYKCRSCKFQTRLLQNLYRHELKHKTKSEMQMFRCNKCNYESKFKEHFKRHQLKHKNIHYGPMYKCRFCKYETWNQSLLPCHLLTHIDRSELK